MDFSLTLPQAEGRLSKFILELDQIGYSKTTLNGYRKRDYAMLSFLMVYEADLLPQVKNSLRLYLQELKPDNSDTPLFQRSTAPFGRMSRSGVYCIFKVAEFC